MDRQYLRICAVYRLMDRRGLSKDRAVELLAERNVKNAVALVGHWLAWPLSEKGRANRQRFSELNLLQSA